LPVRAKIVLRAAVVASVVAGIADPAATAIVNADAIFKS
jgi:hypothetical protein